MTFSIPAGEGKRPPSAPSVCVLILNYNGWKDTIECLESLFRMRYPRFQVVVCDNASADGSVERIEEWARGALVAEREDPALPEPGGAPVPKPVPCVVLDREEAERGGGGTSAPLVVVRNGVNGGFAAGNNVGLRYVLARGDAEYVWLLNPDTVVHADALAALVHAAEADPRLAMTGGRLMFYHHPDVIQVVGGGTLSRWKGTTDLYGRFAPGDTEPVPGPMDYIHGACILVRREVLRSVGLMDERYFLYSEEVDWCLRALGAGWRLGYAAECRVWHKEGASMTEVRPTQEYQTIRSRLILMRSHFPLRFPAIVAFNLVGNVIPKLRRRQPEGLRLVLSVFHDYFRRNPPPATRRGGRGA